MSRKGKIFFAGTLLAVSFMFIFVSFGASAAFAQAVNLPRNLKLGDSGSDVLLLQKFLNNDPATRVAASGVGSPGHESTYFGLLTKQAVIRFQQKYASEVLAPVQLQAGTGFVGALTRQKINSLASSAPAPTNSVSVSYNVPSLPLAPAASQGTPAVSVPPVVSTNPAPQVLPMTMPHSNLQNLDAFVQGLGQVQVKNGIDPAKAAQEMEYIRQLAMTTTTDFQAEFIRRNLQVKNLVALNKGASCTQQKPVNVWQSLKPLFAPDVALAALGLPFGGPPWYIFPCDCSATTILAFSPPWTPGSAVYLDYVDGTQAFDYHTAPAATEYLGVYTPGAGETCEEYIGYGCLPIPTEGLILPELGTNL